MFKFARNGVSRILTDVSSTISVPAPGQADRRQLLDHICNFLLEHELEVSPGNLALAQEVVSGSNPRLSSRIAARKLANEPVTQGWLDGLVDDHAAGCDAVSQHPDFAAVLEHQVRAARIAGEPLSVAFCNIDRFVAINDNHGRDIGDRVIQAVGRVLQRISGENCHVARHGSEDFAVLFRGFTPDQAADRLNLARDNFARRKLIDRTTHVAIGSVTVSGGVADVFGYSDPQAALKAADEALHAAKEQGRNCVVVARNLA